MGRGEEGRRGGESGEVEYGTFGCLGAWRMWVNAEAALDVGLRSCDVSRAPHVSIWMDFD